MSLNQITFDPILSKAQDRAIPKRLRASIADYLDSGTMIFPLMEATEDALNPGNYISGGSSILSDGYSFWRADTGYYVRKYGTPIELGVVIAAAEKGWKHEGLSEEGKQMVTEELITRGFDWGFPLVE